MHAISFVPDAKLGNVDEPRVALVRCNLFVSPIGNLIDRP